jgi:hypothetical protein
MVNPIFESMIKDYPLIVAKKSPVLYYLTVEDGYYIGLSYCRRTTDGQFGRITRVALDRHWYPVRELRPHRHNDDLKIDYHLITPKLLEEATAVIHALAPHSGVLPAFPPAVPLYHGAQAIIDIITRQIVGYAVSSPSEGLVIQTMDSPDTGKPIGSKTIREAEYQIYAPRLRNVMLADFRAGTLDPYYSDIPEYGVEVKAPKAPKKFVGHVKDLQPTG